MKGTLVKKGNMWYVMRLEENEWETYYPLDPDDELKIRELEQVFDNLEARVAANPEVEFEVEDFWETGLEEVIKVAKLK
jgi:hypothetical protein